ncbi:hypothetical protein G4B88_015865 [Cannabis sativa]|uniref:Zinc knuckle CX2CX4HX4C domain-containing protein n=1 Tax=Cannabis sativa TaxID=3483 RepID=A0A7J6DSW8_CANSA|nr:hypothetical protein G4B88_015865 [Cannabis sativa]
MTMDLDEEKPASWNVFLRVQVDLEFTKPLVSGCYFDLYSGVKRWLQFKYEKIRIFCYNGGCLGHQRRGYSLSSPVTVASCDGVPFPLYGPWLSMASSYQDVFSGAQPIPRLGSTVATLEASKALPPPTISNPVDGKLMPLFPRLVEVRGVRGWKGSVCRELVISPMGNGVDVRMSRKEMSPASFPILEDILVDFGGQLSGICSLNVGLNALGGEMGPAGQDIGVTLVLKPLLRQMFKPLLSRKENCMETPILCAQDLRRLSKNTCAFSSTSHGTPTRKRKIKRPRLPMKTPLKTSRIP